MNRILTMVAIALALALVVAASPAAAEPGPEPCRICNAEYPCSHGICVKEPGAMFGCCEGGTGGWGPPCSSHSQCNATGGDEWCCTILGCEPCYLDYSGDDPEDQALLPYGPAAWAAIIESPGC